MDDTTTQEIEERLSERLLVNNTEKDDYIESGNTLQGGFRIDGSSSHVEFGGATTIIENGGAVIVDGTSGFGGPLQPVYRDAPFAIAFFLHLGVVFFFAMAWGFSAFGNNNNEDDGSDTPNNQEDDYRYEEEYDNPDNEDYGNAGDSSPSLFVLLCLALFTCAVSIGISALSLKVMMHHAETLIQASLIGSCGLLVVLSVLFLFSGAVWASLVWFLVALSTAWYARRAWHRIPFASSTLRTALSAIQTNAGVCAVAYGIAALAVVWTIVWFLAFVGVNYKDGKTSCDNDGANCTTNLSVSFVIFMIMSFFWTIQVFQNVLHVTVSGVVGTWWFAPTEALSVFSPAIVDSFRRATTYSFGSICMGSLLVSIIQTLETMVRNSRKYRTTSMLTCILDCILTMLSKIAVYFNRWAYCYVGLYGFDYISSGTKAMDLFRAKGWTNIITDDLVHRSLKMVAVVVGALSGFLGMLLGTATGWNTGGSSAYLLFVPGFFIGLSMATIMINVVLSAVDTVIVAFAEAPSEFETHHPALASNMMQKWRLVFPDECGF